MLCASPIFCYAHLLPVSLQPPYIIIWPAQLYHYDATPYEQFWSSSEASSSSCIVVPSQPIILHAFVSQSCGCGAITLHILYQSYSTCTLWHLSSFHLYIHCIFILGHIIISCINSIIDINQLNHAHTHVDINDNPNANITIATLGFTQSISIMIYQSTRWHYLLLKCHFPTLTSTTIIRIANSTQ